MSEEYAYVITTHWGGKPPEVAKSLIAKRSDKQVRLSNKGSDREPFGFRTILDPAEVDLTPEAAWLRYLAKCEARVKRTRTDYYEAQGKARQAREYAVKAGIPTAVAYDDSRDAAHPSRGAGEAGR